MNTTPVWGKRVAEQEIGMLRYVASYREGRRAARWHVDSSPLSLLELLDAVEGDRDVEQIMLGVYLISRRSTRTPLSIINTTGQPRMPQAIQKVAAMQGWPPYTTTY